MRILRIAARCGVLWAGCAVASAQVYPSRPITMVVPFAAGGPVDTVARILSEPMRASLGQSIIVENVTGAAGSIGVGRVARAAPDGYTLSIGHWSTHVVNGAIYALPLRPVAAISSRSCCCPAIRDDRGQQERRAGEGPQRSSSAGSKRTRAKSRPERRAQAPRPMSPASIFRTSPAPASSSSRIAAPARRCRIWWPVRSISSSTRHRIRCQHVRDGKIQRLRRHGQCAPAVGARHSDRGRGRPAVARHQRLVWPVGAQGHAEGDHRQAQRRRRAGPGRSRRAATASASSASTFRRATS